jgi:membrane protein implicated in regulation of membrane protease activity
MSELNVVEIVVAVVIVVSLVEVIVVRRIIRNLTETEKMVAILLRDKLKGEMGDMVENMKKGLENLFNPKDETKNNVKKTRTNSKTK